MGLVNGALTLTRYEVRGETPHDFKDWLERRIRRFAFRHIEDTTDELALGWCAVDDYLDTEFAYAAYDLSPYIVLGMRLDQRKVPAPLLKKYHRLEMAKARQLREDRKLSRGEREELRDKVRLQLLARIPPTSRLFEASWDTNRNEVWLSSATRGVMDHFEDLFTRTFELRLVQKIPFLLARQVLGDEKLALRLEGLAPLDLTGGGEG